MVKVVFPLALVVAVYLAIAGPFPTVAREGQADGWEILETILSDTSGDTVLTIDGKLHQEKGVEFSLEDVSRLPKNSFTVTHPSTGKKSQYTGVMLKDLLLKLGVKSEATYLTIAASNDYKVAVKLADIQRYGYLLSYKKDGVMYSELPPEHNRGPLAIAIDFDAFPELDYEIYKHQLVWFVDRITVN